MSTTVSPAREPPFNGAELTMLAHLYRGEMYRSKVWRTRLDATTNWAVATTGIALSVAFSNVENSPLPLVLVALLDLVFLAIEARRYRYFDIWRTRVRQMEVSMYGPLLRLETSARGRTLCGQAAFGKIRLSPSPWHRFCSTPVSRARSVGSNALKVTEDCLATTALPPQPVQS